jgi:hypothetical protein
LPLVPTIVYSMTARSATRRRQCFHRERNLHVILFQTLDRDGWRKAAGHHTHTTQNRIYTSPKCRRTSIDGAFDCSPSKALGQDAIDKAADQISGRDVSCLRIMVVTTRLSWHLLSPDRRRVTCRPEVIRFKNFCPQRLRRKIYANDEPDGPGNLRG